MREASRFVDINQEFVSPCTAMTGICIAHQPVASFDALPIHCRCSTTKQISVSEQGRTDEDTAVMITLGSPTQDIRNALSTSLKLACKCYYGVAVLTKPRDSPKRSERSCKAARRRNDCTLRMPPAPTPGSPAAGLLSASQKRSHLVPYQNHKSNTCC